MLAFLLQDLYYNMTMLEWWVSNTLHEPLFIPYDLKISKLSLVFHGCLVSWMYLFQTHSEHVSSPCKIHCMALMSLSIQIQLLYVSSSISVHASCKTTTYLVLSLKFNINFWFSYLWIIHVFWCFSDSIFAIRANGQSLCKCKSHNSFGYA